MSKVKPEYVNLSNLQKIRTVIDGVPDEALDLGIIRNDCGSVGCIIGWCAGSPLFHDEGLVPALRADGAYKRASVCLGSSEMAYDVAANYVFFSGDHSHRSSADLFGSVGYGNYDHEFFLQVPGPLPGGRLEREKPLQSSPSLTRKLIFWRIGSFLVDVMGMSPDDVIANGYVPEGFAFQTQFEFQMPESLTRAIHELRDLGCAVIVFNPDEIKGQDRARIEARGVQFINEWFYLRIDEGDQA